jgi:hypothetical protein
MDSDAEIENHERQLEQTLLRPFMRQNDAKSWHLGISWELNKALNFSLFIFWYTDFSKINDCEPLLLAP